MKKQELMADMRSCLGVKGFITRVELSKYMNRKDPHNIDKYLHGLPAVDGKYYYLGDVAGMLIERSVMK